ncbi:hypothetical protein [Arcobacter sp. YIC-80]|uniref:hypothetical protein n=1 Tax=unclassified Arcobacter TaxID=2593671 RepID=UPI003851590D
MIKSILLAICVSLVLSGCLGTEEKKIEKWHSFIYPDKTNTKRNLKSPMTFDSLKQCKEESIKQLETMGISKTGTFKCGLNCSFHDGMKLEICEKMLAPSEK